MTKALIFVLVAEAWITVGQIFFKKGANRLHSQAEDKNWFMHVMQGLLSYPALWMGAAAMLVGLVFWLMALNCGELNYVYLLGSIQYIFALVAAHFILHEKITLNKAIGTLLITIGIVLTIIS